jgi:hypothetical protein
VTELLATLVVAWFALSAAFGWAWSRAAAPKSDLERRREDEEQIAYLRAWRELREERARARGTLTRDEEHA